MTEHEQAEADLFRVITEISGLLPKFGHLHKRQMLGGPFGAGRFHLATGPCMLNGLNAVYFFVIEAESGAAISCGFEKAEAIKVARTVLTTVDKTALAVFLGGIKTKREAEEAERRRIEREAEDTVAAARKARAAKLPSISRRRRQIFDEADGKCHYCATPLTLDGKWHVEHKMPKALGGDNAPGNLVAACVKCNHEKRDKTDLEYIAARKARTTA